MLISDEGWVGCMVKITGAAIAEIMKEFKEAFNGGKEPFVRLKMEVC
jgi:hypothetical protein